MAKRVFTTILLLGLAAAQPTHADAQQPNGQQPRWQIIGVGAIPGGCGKWIAAPENSETYDIYLGWLLGYLSGANMASVVGGSRDFIDDYDSQSLIPWTKNWCRAHPLDNVADAALALGTELIKRKLAPLS